VAPYSIVAGRLLWLTCPARQEPEASCAAVFEPVPWQVLHRAVHPEQAPPATPPTRALAVRQVARVGGFGARRHDGAPGVQVLWRGLRRLEDLVQGCQLNHPEHRMPPEVVGKE
jgi:hypothetical protein